MNRFCVIWDDNSCSAYDGERIGELIDTQDCHDSFQVFYVDDWKFWRVEVRNKREQSQIADSCVYAVSELWANGKIVGHVQHTDH